MLFDYNKALERFMGEEEILLDVLKPYLDNLEKCINELKKLDPKTDCIKIRELAHSIKGSSLNLDIIPLGEKSELLEDCAYKGQTEIIPELILAVEELAGKTESELNKYI